jgi:hypothetical protein
VSSYDISGVGPATASFQKLGVTLSTVTVDSLEPGDWNVTVNANNSQGLQLASTSLPVTLVAGETASMNAALSPQAGNGTLDVYLEWPTANVVTSPAAALTPPGGTPQVITLPAVATVGALSSIHATPAFKAGFYTLSISYLDGNGFTWGGAEAVRISPQATTMLVFKPFDTVKLAISPDISKNTAITFSGDKPNLGVGGEMTVTAALTQMTSTKDTLYSWYLNGVHVGVASSSAITIKAADLGKGSYRLDVVVATQGVLISDKTVFTIAGG